MDSVRSGPFGLIFRPDSFLFGEFITVKIRFLLKSLETTIYGCHTKPEY